MTDATTMTEDEAVKAKLKALNNAFTTTSAAEYQQMRDAYSTASRFKAAMVFTDYMARREIMGTKYQAQCRALTQRR